MFHIFKSPRFIDICQQWLDIHAVEIAASTEYSYRRQLCQISRYFGDVKIKDISTELLQGFVGYLRGSGLSDTSIHKYFATLKLCFDFAGELGYLKNDPLDGVAVPRRCRVEIVPFSETEIELVLQQDAPDWVKDGIIIAFRTGMRLGEVYALKWSDINFAESFIMVQRAQSRAGSQVAIKTTKTPSGVRRIDIDTFLLIHLMDMHEKTESEYVFPSPSQPEHFRVPWNVSTYLRSMCQRAGIPGRNFHALRHTHATVLLAHGVHPKIVQERLGHSDTEITMMVYSHVSPTMQMEAVKVFEHI